MLEERIRNSLQNPEKLLREEKERMKMPQLAIMDLGARTEANTNFNKRLWYNPRLDSQTGMHGDDRKEDNFMGMMDTILSGEYEATTIIWKKRGDSDGNWSKTRYISKIALQCSTDFGVTWVNYRSKQAKPGEKYDWLETGQTRKTP